MQIFKSPLAAMVPLLLAGLVRSPLYGDENAAKSPDSGTPTSAAEGVKSETQASKFRGRLPPYYKDVVDPSQKEEIYKIQAEYGEKILVLQAQIRKLLAERDASIAKVLSEEQHQRVRKLKDDAAARRSSPQSSSTPQANAPSDGKPADKS